MTVQFGQLGPKLPLQVDCAPMYYEAVAFTVYAEDLEWNWNLLGE
jgi:hypothetical protein